ncbi:MAG: sugar ABC transporter permease, partial [Candidatus Bathyarchaeia archaeon]
MGRIKLSRSLFFIPALSLISLFVIFPVFNTVYISFFAPSGEFVGLDNYFDVLSRREMINIERISEGKTNRLGALVHNAIWILIHLPL